MIDQPTIDRILDAANIVDVVSDFVTLRRRGVNLVGLCPFHDDKSPSFYVSPAKNICKCFACGEGGTPVHFIMKHEQLTYYDALRYLAKKYNIEIKERELSDEEKRVRNDRESMFIVNEWALKYFTNLLYNHVDGQTIGMRYFAERGFREDTIKKFQLGYSLDVRDALYNEAIRNGYKKEYLEKTGLIVTHDNGSVSDRFRGRVMFPVFTLSGKVVAFGGRVLKKDEKTAKYVNSPESDIYHKSNELYGIYFAKQAIVKADKCFLVEGYTDVISMHQSGVENVVASSGTALTEGQIRMIRRFTNNITVLYDGDAPGIKAAIRGIDMLLEAGMNIKVVLLPDGEDPDSYAKSHSASEFAEYIKGAETDFIRFKTKLLLTEAGNDPIRKASLISDIIRSIAIIPDNISRSVYVHECSASFEIEEQVLLNEVSRIRLNHQEQHPKPPILRRNVTPGSIPAVSVPTSSTEQQAEPQYRNEEQVVEQQFEHTVPLSSPYEQSERLLMYYIIRYGEKIIFQQTDPATGQNIVFRVADYIQFDLHRDDLAFHNPLYQKMAEEAAAHCTEDGFLAHKYFLSNTDPEVSMLAADFMSDQYQLSRIFLKFNGGKNDVENEEENDEDHLQAKVLQAVYELKNDYILRKINELQGEMKEAQNTGQMDKVMDLLQQVSRLNGIKNELNKQLGERIVLKL
jgi:DNA primase